jgi:trans-aconitate 2-methyltransferase
MTVVWDPAQYGKFAEGRTRPVAEMLNRIPLDAPSKIYDLGCGDGRVTQLLAARWPDAHITGVDSSSEMLEEARKLLPDGHWVEADLAKLSKRWKFKAVMQNSGAA